jgi:hypothetical protein
VRTEEKLFDASSRFAIDQVSEAGMNQLKLGDGEPSSRDSALVGNDEDPETRVVEPANRPARAG